MSTTASPGLKVPALSEEGAVTRFLRATEIDTRMLGMVGALLVIWVGFDIYSGMLRPGEGLFGGSFLTPRNLWILLVQTSSIAVMTTGMVLIIVMRQIDLSVGSMLSLIAVSTGVPAGLQARPRARRRPSSRSGSSPCCSRIALGALIGCIQRRAHRLSPASRPSSSRSAASSPTAACACWVVRGETVAPMDKTFKLIGGNGPLASIGPIWSWILAVVACVGIVWRRSSAAAASAGASSFRCGRSGPRSCSRSSAASRCSAITWRGQFLSVGAQGRREIRHGQQHPDSRRACWTRAATRSAWRPTRSCAAPRA